MLGVGLDWAEAFHVAALGRPQTGVTELRRVEHTPAGLRGLIEHIRTLEPDPAHVRVVVEIRHGLLVDALLAAGFTVLPINPTWSRVGAAQQARRTTPRTRASAACWPSTPTPPCVRWSPIARWPPSYARSPATTPAWAKTSGGCSTGSALTCSPSSPPLSRSATVPTSTAPPCYGSWPSGPPPPRWPGSAGPSSSPWPAAASTATPNASPTGSWPPSAPSSWPSATNSPAPRPTPSHSPPPNCWPSTPNARPGSVAWVSCCSAPPESAVPASPTTTQRGLFWRRDLPQLSRPG